MALLDVVVVGHDKAECFWLLQYKQIMLYIYPRKRSGTTQEIDTWVTREHFLQVPAEKQIFSSEKLSSCSVINTVVMLL